MSLLEVVASRWGFGDADKLDDEGCIPMSCFMPHDFSFLFFGLLTSTTSPYFRHVWILESDLFLFGFGRWGFIIPPSTHSLTACHELFLFLQRVWAVSDVSPRGGLTRGSFLFYSL